MYHIKSTYINNNQIYYVIKIKLKFDSNSSPYNYNIKDIQPLVKFDIKKGRGVD